MLSDLVGQRLQLDSVQVMDRRISAIAPEALLRSATDDPVLAKVMEAVGSAHGIMIATPIYKVGYSGILKCFLDILPQFAMAGKAILPIGTGGSVAHVLALDYA